MRGTLARSTVASCSGNALQSPLPGRTLRIRRIETIRSRLGQTRPLRGAQGLGGSTLAKVLVGSFGRSLLKVRATPTREGVASTGCVAEKREAGPRGPCGRKELACGGQAFIATSLFDPSMS